MKKILATLLLVGVLFGTTEILQPGLAHAGNAVTQHSKANCEKIVKEIKRQQGSVQAQQYLGRFIAWRESGCSLQCVKDSDDLSCSRFGINFKGKGMGRAWGILCGAWDRIATKSLKVDVRCALRAFKKYGTRPWRS